ncbi:probable envelope ADP,ATP carrier protein, chloroplastic [Tanacetum coccineum]|uniref:Probable envelope ADP,ATP carrier protein, chloroplastic n=1 Tax=Tanacetum coccineum TaxID=301880 RepID=A0ABQ5HJK5_9ASTR
MNQQQQQKQPTLIWKHIPGLEPITYEEQNNIWTSGSTGFACVSLSEKKKKIEMGQFLKHPIAVVGLVPKDAAVFVAGAVAGAAAKTVIAPLDRIKLIMQTHGLRAGEESAKKTIGFIEAVISVGKQDGVKGYWKGNLAQVIRILPYSAVQLFAYESYKKLFRGEDGELSVIGRLAAGASAGMTSTFVTYPLDVLRLRMAVDPGHQTMSNVIVRMIKEEGLGSFYKGLVPSLISIAPYVAAVDHMTSNEALLYQKLNPKVDLLTNNRVKKSLPEKFRYKNEASFITAFVAATIATVTCYPLDTIRRQMQMRGTPYNTVLDAFSGIIARDGVAGLYSGFVPNALKTLPNSSIRLTTFDAMKRLIAASEKEFQRILEENRNEQKLDSSSTS